MSTRSSIYYVDAEDNYGVGIHIYYELLNEAPNNVRMEISLPHAKINVRVPADFQRRLGIQGARQENQGQ